MKIKKEILDVVYQQTQGLMFESGGIFGKKNEIITDVDIDKDTSHVKCSYEPNIDRFNIIINEWQKKEIDLAGIFHTHFFGVSTLSDGDISYIKTIMHAMPSEINQLYFPIVLPESKKIIPYLAVREDKIKIELDELIIIE